MYAPAQSDMLAGKAVAAMAGSVGMPAGVQLSTLPFEDELCLRIMADLEKELLVSPGPIPQPPWEL